MPRHSCISDTSDMADEGRCASVDPARPTIRSRPPTSHRHGGDGRGGRGRGRGRLGVSTQSRIQKTGKLVKYLRVTLQLLRSQGQRNGPTRTDEMHTPATGTDSRSTPCGVRSDHTVYAVTLLSLLSRNSFSIRTGSYSRRAHVACLRLSAPSAAAQSPPRPRPRAGAEPSRERHVHGSRVTRSRSHNSHVSTPSQQRYVSGASRPGVTHHSVRGRLLASVMGGGASSSKSSTHSSFSATRVVAGRGGGGAGAGAA